MQRPLPGARGLLAAWLVALVLLEGAQGASFGARNAGFLSRQTARSLERKAKQNPRVDWDYAQHGADWPGMCLSDRRQSPIELPALATLPNTTSTLWYKYNRFEEPVSLYNDGLALSVTFHDKVGGVGMGQSFQQLYQSWSLQQMTIHAPSEHTWGGTHLPVEIQLVHTPSKPGGENAVVSIGFSRGPNNQPNLFWDSLLAHGLPQAKGTEVKTNMQYGETLAFGDLMGDSEFLQYSGSASQPPCIPNVQYFVRQEPIPANPDRLQAVMDLLDLMTAQTDGNYRVPQPLNNRTVSRMKAVAADGLETAEQIFRKGLASADPTASPSLPILEENLDEDHEDSTRETDEVKLHYWYSDPTGDLARAKKERADSANDVMNSYTSSMINDNPDGIVAEMPEVVEAKTAVGDAAIELTQAQQLQDAANAALILAKQARDYAEGRTNLTAAEAGLMSAQDEASAKESVVLALENKKKIAEATLVSAQGTGHAQVWWAQKQLERLGDSLPGAGGVEPAVPLSYELPTGPYTDPFSASTAESRSRIVEQPLPQHLTQALGPNHIYVAGTVMVGKAAQEAAVTPAPSGIVPAANAEPVVVDG